MRYKPIQLGEVAEVINGYAFKSKDFRDKGVPVIKIKNIIPPIVSIEDVQYVSEELYNEKEKFRINYDDILISMTGSGVNQMASAVGKVGRLKVKEKALLNQRVGKIKILDNAYYDENFLFYVLSQENIQYTLASSAGGSANQANISPKHIKDLILPNPPIHIQRIIGKLLYNIDSKVLENKYIVKKLEELSQTLFKQWFIDFEFPIENGLPYKSSGGKMVESELGEVPVGWKVYSLDEFTESISNSINKKVISYARFLNTSDISEGKIEKVELNPTDKMPGQAKKLIQKGDILYSEIRPKNKRYAFVDFEASEYVVSTKLMVLRVNDEIYSNKLLYLWLSMDETINELQHVAEDRSGTFPQITFSILSKYKFAVPEKIELNKLLNVFNPMLDKKQYIIRENEKLIELRDYLLPGLLSGEIVIPDESVVG